MTHTRTSCWIVFSAVVLSTLPDAAGDGGINIWEELGPKNAGGRIRSILVHPSDPNILWLGSVSGGIFKTINGGASWFPVAEFMPSLAINCMALDPHDSNALYAGTGEGFAARESREDGRPGDGIFKSTDGGLSWRQLVGTAMRYNDDNRYVNRIAISPIDPDLLVVATDAGIQRSTNGGNDFELAYTGRATDVSFSPTDSNDQRLVAGLDPLPDCIVGTDPDPCGGEYTCALFSEDRGETWQDAVFDGIAGSTTLNAVAAAGATSIVVVSSADFCYKDVLRIGSGASSELVRIRSNTQNEPTTLSIHPALRMAHSIGEPIALEVSQRTELAWARSVPGTVYASVGAGGGTIWKSIDNGVTYQFRSNPDSQNSIMDYTIAGGGSDDRAFYNNLIWVAPNDANLLIVGGFELIRSMDGGLTFQRIGNRGNFRLRTSIHSDNHIVVSHARFGVIGDPDAETVFAGNDGGIQKVANTRSVTSSTPWTHLNNMLGISQLYGGCVSTDGALALGCSQDNDVLRYDVNDGPNEWFLWVSAGDATRCAIDYNNPNLPILYARGNSAGYIGKSTDLGVSYQSVFDSANDSRIAAFVADPNPSNPTILYAGGLKIWRTDDAAASWTPIRTSLASSPYCRALDVAIGNANRVWAGYSNGAVARTQAVLTDWVAVGAGALPSKVVSDIAISPHDSSHVFVTFGGEVALNDPLDTAWYTADDGQNWEVRVGTPPNELPRVPINTVTFHPARPDWVFVGTDQGVYASEDRGITWSITPTFSLHEGPANVPVTELLWQDEEHLCISTYGRGMFRTRALPIVYVDVVYSGIERGTATQPYDTVREAIDAAGNGTDISIRAGIYNEQSTLTLAKRGLVSATGGTVTIR